MNAIRLPPPLVPPTTSTLTDTHRKLIALSGALEAAEWLTVLVLATVTGPSPLGNPPLHDDLVHLQYVLTWAQGRLLNHACPESTP